MVFGFNSKIESIPERRDERKAAREACIREVHAIDQRRNKLRDRWVIIALLFLVVGVGVAIFYSLQIGLLVVVLAFCVNILSLVSYVFETQRVAEVALYVNQLYILEIRDDLLDELKRGEERQT